MTDIFQDVILWYAGQYDPAMAIMALCFVLDVLLFIGTSPWWWKE